LYFRIFSLILISIKKMKNIYIALGTACTTLLIFSMCFFSSCLKDKNPIKMNGTVITPCKNSICYNGGACIDGACHCTAGYEGDSCKITWNSHYLATYEANDQCSIGNNYNVSITPIINNPGGIVLNNISKFCMDMQLQGIINPERTSVNFPLQRFCDTKYVSGTATQTADGGYINCWLTSRDTITHTQEECSIVLRKL
jgi:hypothetical protein